MGIKVITHGRALWILPVLTALSAALGPPANAASVARKVAEFKDQYYVSALTFNGDGTQLAVNFMVQGLDVHVWEWQGHSHIIHMLRKPAPPGDGHALEYSPDGTVLAVRHDMLDDGRLIRVWDARTGELVHDVRETGQQGHFVSFDFTPDGKWLLRTISRNIYLPGEQFVVHRTDTWEEAWSLRTLPLFQPVIVAASPDGTLAALGGNNAENQVPQIAFVDLAERKVVRMIDNAFPHADRIATLAWSPDGLHIAAGVGVGGSHPGPDAVKIFDVVTGKQIAGVAASDAAVTGLMFSRDGRYLIAGSIDNSVRILDGHSFGPLQKISGDIRSLAISRDSRHLAIAEYNKVSVWDLKQ